MRVSKAAPAMPFPDSALEVDAARATKDVEQYVKRILRANSASGVLIGLSGGIDSAVLATLAARALGKNLVRVCYLYDRDSEESSERKARLMAKWLELKLEAVSIEPAMRDRGVYAPLALRVSAVSGLINRCVNSAYCLAFRESPFMSTLRVGSGEVGGDRLKKLVYNAAIRHVEASFNARHIYRREELEERATRQNLLLLGAANRSEWLTGWFVKGGIDDVPFSPLKVFYKTQVWQLAEFLSLPVQIRNQTASPDMMKGITDEFAMGVSYGKIDIILAGMERGLSDEEIIADGVRRKELRLVREMHRLSSWKRECEGNRLSARYSSGCRRAQPVTHAS